MNVIGTKAAMTGIGRLCLGLLVATVVLMGVAGWGHPAIAGRLWPRC